MLSQRFNGAALVGKVRRQLVAHGTVVVAVLQVVVQFGVLEHGFFGAHREQPGLLRPVVLQAEVAGKVLHARIQNGLVHGALRGLLKRGKLLHDVRRGLLRLC